MAEDDNGPTLSGVREVAVRRGVTVVAGSLPLRRDDGIYNKTMVIGPHGQTVAAYEKLHLFTMMGEERFFAAGPSRRSFALGGLPVGLAICYDLRFPELFRALALEGAQVIFLPAEWPAARADHWLTLTRARAIENQLYLCAVNCVGEHRGNPFYGHSLLIGPSGEIVAAGGGEEAIIYGDIDPAVVAATRAGMQVWPDRRPEAYM